jgi:hypothetical protein
VFRHDVTQGFNVNICIHETRLEDEVGVKLLLLSLSAHHPDAQVFVSTSALSGRLNSWIKDHCNSHFIDLGLDQGLTWNVKPALLLALLDSGLDEVIWLDSDLIITQPIARYFSSVPAEALVLAEEYFTIRNRGIAPRARGWGLNVGRDLPYTPNTCVVRVTQCHRPLLVSWQRLLDRPDYVKLQGESWVGRPFYMMGDQDALGALLGSVDYKDVKISRLRRGRDIAQCFQADGYGPFERVQNFFAKLPPFVHAQGEKPWRSSARDKTYQQLSAYRYAALPYFQQLDLHERDWLVHQNREALVWDQMVGSHPSLAGLGRAISRRVVKRVLGSLRLIGLSAR